jgi:outer membrane protein assembly factor BamB
MDRRIIETPSGVSYQGSTPQVVPVMETATGESAEQPEGVVILRSLIGSSGGEVATSIIELDSGDFLVAGYDYGQTDDISEWDALVMRISADGELVWQRSTDRSGSEYAWAVRKASADRYVVVGTRETELGDTDGFMQNIDAEGDQYWLKTYGGPGEEIFWTAEPFPEGGFLLAGQTDSEGAGGLDFYLVRTDTEGQEIWANTYGTADTDRAFGIGLSPDGGALICGFSGANRSRMNLFFVRIDADGRELWRRTIAGDRFDVAHDVLSLPDGGFAISGYTSSYSPGDHDGFLMRLSSDGRMLWMKTYGDNGDDRILHVAQMDDGGFAMIGYTDWDLWVLRVDSVGTLLWLLSDGGFQPDVGKDIIVLRDGLIAAVGGNRSDNPPNDDLILLVLQDNRSP